MKKLWLVLLTFVFAMGIIGVGTLFAEHDDDMEVNKKEDIELTDDQKEEMEELHTELFEVHKKILEKYAEYGVLTKEKVEKKLEHMEKYHEELKENGYIPDWHHKKDKMKNRE